MGIGLRGLAVLAAMGLIGTPCRAERIILRNNSVIEAQITSTDDKFVSIKRADGSTMKLSRSQIARIEQSAPGIMEMQRAQDALQRGDLRAARVLLLAAVEAGAESSRVNEILADLANREKEIELKVHGSRLRDFEGAVAKADFATAEKTLAQLETDVAKDSPLREDLRKCWIEFYLRRAQSRRDTVDDGAAIADLQMVHELDPNRAQVYLEMADIYAKNSKTRRQALENYEKGLALAGESLDRKQLARIHFELANLYREAGRTTDAFREYRFVHSIDKRFDPRLEDRIIRACYDSVAATEDEDPQRAIEYIDQGIAVRREADLLDRKARLLVALGRYDEATATYRQVLEVHPTYKDAHYNLAQLALRRSELFEARQLLDVELANYPDNYKALCQLGELSLQRDDYEAALGFFEKAHKADKEQTRAKVGLARTLRLQKKYAEARVYVVQLLALNPMDLDANLEMGRILRGEENYEEAAKLYSYVLDLLDAHKGKLDETMTRLKADALIARGEVRLLTTGPSTANADFSQALEVLPEYPAAFYNIGQAYKSKYGFSKLKGDLDEAVRNLEKARALAPKDPSYALALGILFHQTMAQVDQDNKADYLRKAAANYRDYIALGGADSESVEGWIKECES